MTNTTKIKASKQITKLIKVVAIESGGNIFQVQVRNGNKCEYTFCVNNIKQARSAWVKAVCEAKSLSERVAVCAI